MRLSREHTAAVLSAPLMVGGLVATALADNWSVRLGGIAMVVGASVALALTGRRARPLAWALALLGVVAVVAGCL